MSAKMPVNEPVNEIVASEDIEWINGLPTPPTMPLRPLHGVRSVFRLLRNKEDTSQVFEIVQALAGRSGKQLFQRFTATPYGRRVVTAPVVLENILSDRDALRKMPEGSLGRAYLAFMEEENLSAEGLFDAAEEAGIEFRGDTQFEEFRRMFMHLDVSHDLWHVITGYGRDALGELCNLVFTRHQTGNRGFSLIILIGKVAQKIEAPSADILKSLAEAKRHTKQANWILEFDIEEILPLPLSTVREKLNLAEPVIYNSVPREIKDRLLKPKAVVAHNANDDIGAPANVS